jgi:HSP20 family protein
MALWNPFRELEKLHKLRPRLHRARRSVRLPEPSSVPVLAPPHFPLVNLSEDQGYVHASVLLPGIDPEDLEISVTQDSLVLSGLRKPFSEPGPPPDWQRRDRVTGKFERRIDLLFFVDGDRTRADLRDGLLTVTMPKSTPGPSKQIAIEIPSAREKLDMPIPESSEAAAGEHIERGISHPLVDIIETEQKIIILADMPGVRQIEIDIDSDRDIMIFRGEMDFVEKGRPIFREFTPTFLHGEVDLPAQVDLDNALAQHRQGVLSVTLPKATAGNRRMAANTAETRQKVRQKVRKIEVH